MLFPTPSSLISATLLLASLVSALPAGKPAPFAPEADLARRATTAAQKAAAAKVKAAAVASASKSASLSKSKSLSLSKAKAKAAVKTTKSESASASVRAEAAYSR